MSEPTIKGAWIPLIKPITDLSTDGLPRIGDVVKVVYDDSKPPWSGEAMLIINSADNTYDKYYSPEVGADIIYSPKF